MKLLLKFHFFSIMGRSEINIVISYSCDLKSFVYLSVFAVLIFSLSAFTTPDAHAVTTGFQDDYAPSNWTLTRINSDGSVDTSGAPAFIKLIGGDNQSGTPGNTDYTIEILCDGTVTFFWIFDGEPVTESTGPTYDPSGYLINGAFVQITNDVGPEVQAGFVSVPVFQGYRFGFSIHSLDNIIGPGIFVQLSNFEGPSCVPTANAGPDQAYNSGVGITLDGSASSIPGGGSVDSYFWQQVDGPSVVLNDDEIAKPTFYAPINPDKTDVDYIFELHVADVNGVQSLPDQVTIKICSVYAQATVENDESFCDHSRVEVRGKPTDIPIPCGPTLCNHLFIIFTDVDGVEWYSRGGPTGLLCPIRYCGDIFVSGGKYDSAAEDWYPSAVSKEIAKGSIPFGKFTCLLTNGNLINSWMIPYKPLGPNSNSVVRTLLQSCGLPQEKPDVVAPGWNQILIEGGYDKIKKPKK